MQPLFLQWHGYSSLCFGEWRERQAEKYNIILSNGIVTFNEGPSHRRLNLRRAILLWWIVSVMASMLESNCIQELVSIHICLRNEGKGRLKNFVSMVGYINFEGWLTWLSVELHWKLSINKDIGGGIHQQKPGCNRSLCIAICVLFCNRCNNGIMTSIALLPYYSQI